MVQMKIKVFILALLLSFFAGCLSLSSGGGTDVDNAIVQGEVRMDGQVVAGAEVILMDHHHNPGDVQDQALRKVFSDDDGRYTLKGLDSGDYSLEVHHPNQSFMSMDQFHLGLDSVMQLNVALKKMKTLILPVHDSLVVDGCYIFIPGSLVMSDTIFQENSQHYVVLENVPSTTIDSIYYGVVNEGAHPTGVFWEEELPEFQGDTLDLRDL